MSITGKLLTKILESSANFLEARRAGVSRAVFVSETDAEAWAFIEEYFNKHKAVPPIAEVRRRVPEFVPQDPEGRNVSELIEGVQAALIESRLLQSMREVHALLKQGRHSEAVLAMYRGASSSSISFSSSSDKLLSSSAEYIYNRYKIMKEGGFYHDVPWPWRPLQEATGGIEPGTFNVFYGRPKSTKTWRLLQIAVTARQYGNRVLLVTNELPPEMIFMRLAALECELDYDKFRRGKLSPEEEALFQSYTQTAKAMPPDYDIVVTTLADSDDAKTLSALRAKIDQHEPKLVLIDAVYKMADENTSLRDATPTAMRNISAGLQLLAQRERIPIVVTTQANRKGERNRSGLDDVAHTDALAMDTDLLVKIVNLPDLGRTAFLVKAAREIVLDGFSTANKCATHLGPVILANGEEDWSLPGADSTDVDTAAEADERFTE